MHVALGGNVTWKCHSESDLSKITQWFRWIILENGTEDRVEIPTTVPEELSIVDVKKSDLGTYGCLVVNSIGHDILNVTLEEDLQHHLPVILRDKENQRIRFLAAIGAFFIFAVLVTIFALRTRRKLKDKRVTIIQAKQSFIIRKKVIVEQRDSDKALLSPNIKIEEERVHVDPQEQESGKIMNQYQFQLDPRWEISRACLEFDPEPLGEGAFGIVYKADAFGLIPNTDRVEVAVKMLKNGHSETDLRDLVTEMEVMKKVQGGHTHKNIINLLGCVTQDGMFFVSCLESSFFVFCFSLTRIFSKFSKILLPRNYSLKVLSFMNDSSTHSNYSFFSSTYFSLFFLSFLLSFFRLFLQDLWLSSLNMPPMVIYETFCKRENPVGSMQPMHQIQAADSRMAPPFSQMNREENFSRSKN